MKIKNKGKVYPSPSATTPPPPPSDSNFLSVLKLLPAAILALVSVLSLEDREVLAYMITRSIQTSTPSSSSLVQESKKKSSKKAPLSSSSSITGGGGSSSSSSHKPPIFTCDCFDCYTSYWFRWDSSTNRELIHQAIEAFEDQLSSGEKSKKSIGNGRGKRREKMGRRTPEKSVTVHTQGPTEVDTRETILPVEPGADMAVPMKERECSNNEENEEEKAVVVEVTGELPNEEGESDDDVPVIGRGLSSVGHQHKGLARKVLPDVLGIFNSRLWSLWSPNV